MVSDEGFREVPLEHQERELMTHDSKSGVIPMLWKEEESPMETILEDTAASYIYVSAIGDAESPASVQEKSASFDFCHSREVEDYVWLDADQTAPVPSPWWSSLQIYAQRAARSATRWGWSALEVVTTRTPSTKIAWQGRVPASTQDPSDWVSDTQVEGGRLILPGQLIYWDDSSVDAPVIENPELSQSSQTRSFGGKSASSLVMVSAHDLLAVQGGNRAKDSMDGSSSLPSRSTCRLDESFTGVLLDKIQQKAIQMSNRTHRALRWSLETSMEQAGTYLVILENKTGLMATTAGWMQEALESWFGNEDNMEEVSPPMSLDERDNEEVPLEFVVGVNIELPERIVDDSKDSKGKSQ